MKYRDYKIGFTFEVPDYFSEVRESSYEIFDVAEDTLHYFIQLDDEGEIVRNFSIGARELTDKNQDAKEAVDSFVEMLDEMGYVRVQDNVLITESGREIYRYVLYDEDIGTEMAVLTYVTKVKDHLITSSCLIEEFYDFFEQEMFKIFDSIEEM